MYYEIRTTPLGPPSSFVISTTFEDCKVADARAAQRLVLPELLEMQISRLALRVMVKSFLD